MIKLIKNLPQIFEPKAELIKINCNFQIYKEEALFWAQDGDKALISMLDGNMVIYNKNAEMLELGEFIEVISPASVFSDAKTLQSLFGEAFHTVCVVASSDKFECEGISDRLSSDEIYTLLSVDGLTLPDYQYFAPDFCRRLNRGGLKYFAKKGECAAVTLTDGKYTLLNGIASHKKGGGSAALRGALSGVEGGYALAVCERELLPFYLKNNFKHIYDAGYRRKFK